MVCQTNEQTHRTLRYLDTGYNNHMWGDKSVFFYLDESFRNTVRFGDNSTVFVFGKGKVTFQTKGNSHSISNVLFILDLKSNLLCVGQLHEKGYEISIKDGVCRIQDEKLGLIAQTKMMENRMFPLYLYHATHSCLAIKTETYNMVMALSLRPSQFWWIEDLATEKYGGRPSSI